MTSNCDIRFALCIPRKEKKMVMHQSLYTRRTKKKLYLRIYIEHVQNTERHF